MRFLILDLVVTGILALGGAFLFLRYMQLLPPSERSRRAAGKRNLERVCSWCSEVTDPANGDLCINNKWWHARCYKKVTES